MIEIINIKEVNVGDLLLIEGYNYENEICVITVKKVSKDGLIIPEEMGGLDYSPENPDSIVRIATKEIEPVLTILAQKMLMGFTKKWEERLDIKN